MAWSTWPRVIAELIRRKKPWWDSQRKKENKKEKDTNEGLLGHYGQWKTKGQRRRWWEPGGKIDLLVGGSSLGQQTITTWVVNYFCFIIYKVNHVFEVYLQVLSPWIKTWYFEKPNLIMTWLYPRFANSGLFAVNFGQWSKKWWSKLRSFEPRSTQYLADVRLSVPLLSSTTGASPHPVSAYHGHCGYKTRLLPGSTAEKDDATWLSP